MRSAGGVTGQLQFGGFDARVRKLPSGPASGAQEVNPGQTKSFGGLAPGDYRVEFTCTTTFSSEPPSQHVTLPPDANVSEDGGQLCGIFSEQILQNRRR